MPDHDLEKLLGGFAADTLTPEEKQRLYRVALQDQQLFNTIADEQALKELLTDPAVRRRLVQSLQVTSSQTAGGSPSWFEWFHRPTGLTWAGGLAAAVFAVVLSTRVYQDTMKEADRFAATEEAKSAAPPTSSPSVTQPASPPSHEPQLNVEDNTKQIAPLRREVPPSKTAKRESPVRTKPDERWVRDSSSDSPHQQHVTSGAQRPTESTSDKPTQSEQEVLAQGNPQSAGIPPTVDSPSAPTKMPSATATSGQTSATLSARSLFYGAGPQGRDDSIPGDTRRRDKAGSESAQSPGQSELTPQSLAMAKSNRGSPLQPLGIRYSLTPREQAQHSQDGATDTPTPKAPVELTVESNQDGFLQVWKQVDASKPQLLFPISETEQPRSRLTAHTPLTISIPSRPGMLVIRFSRTDAIPSTAFDRTQFNDSSQHHLRESVITDEASGFLLPTHYVVNQDPSLSEIVVHIAPSQP
jgi:hypothetical protein